MRYIAILITTLTCLMTDAQVNIALIKNASAKFKQVRTSALLAEPVVQTGTFQYEAPDHIQWKYDGLDKVQLPEQILAFIRQAVSGELSTEQDMFVTSWEGKTLTLSPQKKSVKRFFSQIQITFDSAGVATAVVLTEPNNDQTTIEFSQMKYSTL